MLPRALHPAEWIAVALGLFLLATGIGLMVRPDIVEALFGLDDPGSDAPRALAVGIRQAALGASIIALAAARKHWALAITLFIGSIVPIADGLIATHANGLAAGMRHFATVPLSIGLAVVIWRLRQT